MGICATNPRSLVDDQGNGVFTHWRWLCAKKITPDSSTKFNHGVQGSKKATQWQIIAISFMAWLSLGFVAAPDARAKGERFSCRASLACFNNGESCALSGARIFLGGVGTKVFFNEDFITVLALMESEGGVIIATIPPNRQAKITEHRRIDSESIQVITYHAVCSEEE